MVEEGVIKEGVVEEGVVEEEGKEGGDVSNIRRRL